MKKEVISMGPDGKILSELHGFDGAACLAYAAKVASALEGLGIVTELDGIQMKTAEAPAQAVVSRAMVGGES